MDFDNQTIVVTLDVEDDPVVTDDTGVAIAAFDIRLFASAAYPNTSWGCDSQKSGQQLDSVGRQHMVQ